MTKGVGRAKIKSVLVIDDSASGRDGAALTIADAELRPIEERGPLPELQQFVDRAVATADAAYCDHHLAVGQYARFQGAEAVAAFYKRRFPAVLCTKWSKADIDVIRLHLRYIPALIPTDQVSPDLLADGLEKCVEEFKNVFRPSRKPWRTLVRVEEVIQGSSEPMMLGVVVPAWRSDEVIRVRSDLLREVGDVARAGARFHALVNLGAEYQEQLFFVGEAYA